jgi:hypothetical protein
MPGSKQTEAAAQVVFHIGGNKMRVKEIDTSVDVDIQMIFGNNLKPDGWAVKKAEFSGSLAFHGDVAGTVTPMLTRGDGVTPVEGNALTITHMRGRADTFTDVMMGNQGYNMSEGEVTETTYEWVSMDKK